MLSACVDRALVQAAAEVVVLADHTKLGTDTMFQTVPTDLITRLVTDEPPAHDDRAATELQALADQGVQIAVAGASGGQGGDAVPARHQQQRRDVPLPAPRAGPDPGHSGGAPRGLDAGRAVPCRGAGPGRGPAPSLSSAVPTRRRAVRRPDRRVRAGATSRVAPREADALGAALPGDRGRRPRHRRPARRAGP